MRSVLDIGFSTRVPQQNATIPYGYYANGAPFAFYSPGEITSFKIVCLRTRVETELSKTIILSEDSKHYYKATHELGVPRGSYFYKLGIGEVETGGEEYLEANENSYLVYSNAQSYGIWEWDVFYKYGVFPDPGYISFVVLDSSDIFTSSGYQIGINNDSDIYIYRIDSGPPPITLFKITNTVVTEDKRITVTLKRNETLNQYFTGAADALALYIDGVLVDDTGAITGTNPVVDGTYTTLTDNVISGGEGVKIYSPPTIYTVLAGSFTAGQEGGTLTGGSKLYSQVFKIDEHMRGPTPEVGDFSSSDFNNDFLNFEATGVIDENGDEA